MLSPMGVMSNQSRRTTERLFEVVTIEPHDHSVAKLNVVSCVHSARTIVAARAKVAPDSSTRQAGHGDNLSYSSHASLLDFANVRVTVRDAAVHLDVLSRQHLCANFCVVPSLKFAVGVFPASRDPRFDVV